MTDQPTGDILNAYCMDVNTYIENGDQYTEVILQGNSDLSGESAKRIRNILFNAFPYIDFDTLKLRCSISDLTQEEAITGAQLAIWKLKNDFDLPNPHSHPNVNTLKDWYLDLPPIGIVLDPATISLMVEPSFTPNKCAIKYTFKSTEKNQNGTDVELTFSFNKDIQTIYGAIVNISVGGDTTVVDVSNIPHDANFTLLINGVQILPYEAYRYKNAQDLVGLIMQQNTMNATSYFACKGNCGYDIFSINKSVKEMVNSITTLEHILHGKLEMFSDCLCNESEER